MFKYFIINNSNKDLKEKLVDVPTKSPIEDLEKNITFDLKKKMEKNVEKKNKNKHNTDNENNDNESSENEDSDNSNFTSDDYESETKKNINTKKQKKLKKFL